MSDRRRYPRVQADVICRPAGTAIFHHKRNTQDVSLGGVRVFSDERLEVGRRLDLDIMLAPGGSLHCWAEVVWIVELGTAAPAKFDVGLKFTDMKPSELQQLASVLAQAR